MRYVYDKDLKKVVKCKATSSGHRMTIIPDEPEFVSRDAFPEAVKWTGRRSKKQIMKKYNCVDYRDTRGVERAKLKKQAMIREARKDPNVFTNIDLIKEKGVKDRKQTRRKYFFTGR